MAVTGATGFIGRYVVRELESRNVDVVATARSADPALPTAGNARWIQLDIRRPGPDSFEMLGHPDVLIHLAWDGLPDYRSPHHFETELPSQYAFVRELVSQGLPSVLITGTCFEYGLQSGELSETDDTKPETPYGFAKDALRRELDFLQQNHPFDLTWARLFYMYGEGQSPSSLWSQLKGAFERGDAVFAMSGGDQIRDYLHVRSVAKYLVDLALARGGFGVVNVCSGAGLSVREWVRTWIQDNKWEIALNLGVYPYTDYEPMAFWGNPAKLHSVLSEVGVRDPA